MNSTFKMQNSTVSYNQAMGINTEDGDTATDGNTAQEKSGGISAKGCTVTRNKAKVEDRLTF